MNVFGAVRDRTACRAAIAAFGVLSLGACSGAPEAELAAPVDIAIDGSRIFPESITSDADGAIYIGSNGGTIYRAAAGSDTAIAWVTPNEENGLLALFGVLVDDKAGLLWTCSNPNSFVPGSVQGPSTLKALDLATGALSATYEFPEGGPTACNDIAVASDGTAYASETMSGRIFTATPGSDEFTLFASGEELVGIDGIAFADDGAIYINNVRQQLVQRVEVDDAGAYAGLTTLELSMALEGPDGLRPLGGNRFLQAEGGAGRVAIVEVEGDSATIIPVQTGLDSSAGTTWVGNVGYATEGKIEFLFNPEMRDQDPGQFVIRAFNLPEES